MFVSLRLLSLALVTSSLAGCSDSAKQMWTRDEIVDIADDSIDASGVRDDTDESVKADLEGLDAQHRALVEIVTQQQAVIDAQSRQIDALNSSMTAAENSLSAIENRLQM